MSNGVSLASLPPRFQDQVSKQLYPAPKPMLRQQQGEKLNRTEREFFNYLKSCFPNNPVRAQAIKLVIANGVTYTPDFVVTQDGRTHFYETKGFMRDDAAVKIKVAAHAFPEFGFTLVKKISKSAGGGWQMQEVLP